MLPSDVLTAVPSAKFDFKFEAVSDVHLLVRMRDETNDNMFRASDPAGSLALMFWRYCATATRYNSKPGT